MYLRVSKDFVFPVNASRRAPGVQRSLGGDNQEQTVAEWDQSRDSECLADKDYISMIS